MNWRLRAINARMADDNRFDAAIHGVKLEGASAESTPEVEDFDQSKIDEHLARREREKRVELNGV